MYALFINILRYGIVIVFICSFLELLAIFYLCYLLILIFVYLLYLFSGVHVDHLECACVSFFFFQFM